jgi:hypothetical protein
MKMLLTVLLMRSIWWQPLSGGKVLCIVFFQYLHILVPGLGSSGAEERKVISFKNMLNLNMIIHVFALADHGLYIKG